ALFGVSEVGIGHWLVLRVESGGVYSEFSANGPWRNERSLGDPLPAPLQLPAFTQRERLCLGRRIALADPSCSTHLEQAHRARFADSPKRRVGGSPRSAPGD